MPFKSDKQRRFLWSQKPEVAKQIAYRQEGGPMMDSRKPKKITQKDRYGNQVSVEYTDEQKPFDINAVLEKLLDRDVPEMFTIPESSPIGGGVSIGFADAHPGEPRGSDTVPAWLTPGEFVVNKEAMDDPQNAQAVRAINEQGRQVQQMKHGGPLQMHRMPGGVAMGGATHMQQGGDTRNFFDRLKLLAGFEDTPAVPDRPTPVTVAPQEPVPTSRPISPEQALIQAREGYREDVYEDTRGYNTVGFGHRTDEPLGSVPYTRAQNESNLVDDIEIAKTNAESYAGDKWKDLNKQQKAALTSMALQLGGAGQREFELMQEALRAGDWAGVRREARDSDWAGQTPARVEDIEAAFRQSGGGVPSYSMFAESRGVTGDKYSPYNPKFHYDPETYKQMVESYGDILKEGDDWLVNQGITNFDQYFKNYYYGGGPIYAQAGLPVGAQGSGRTLMYNPETGQYEYADEQMLPDILAGQEEGAAQAVQDSQSITDQLNQEDLDMYGWNQAAGRPNTRDEATAAGLYTPEVPPFEAPTHTPEAVAQDESEYQQRLAQQIAQAENMVAGGDGDDLGTAGAVPEVPEGNWWEGITDWTFGEKGTAAARKRNEEFNVKAAENNLEAAQEDLAEMEARIEAGEPVNEYTLEQAQAAVENQQDKLIEAGSAAAAFQEEIDAEGVVAAETLLDQANVPGEDDDKATLEGLAESEEFENEDAPDKDSDKGTQSTPEVVAEGEAAAEADPSKLDKAKGFFKDAFSDLFDGKELARMALMYVGSRALGYSHGGSLNWAAKQYTARLEAKQDSINELVKSGKYTPASIQQYKETGDISVLRAPGTPAQPLGNFKTFYKDGKKIRAQEFKVGDAKVWQTADGRAVDSSFHEDPSVVRGTPEYSKRIKDDTKLYTGMVNDLRTQFGTTPGGRDQADTYATELAPSVAGGKISKWALDNNVPAEYMGSIVENAYHAAIEHGRATGDKVRDLTPFLEEQYVAAQVGDTSLFKNEDGKTIDGVNVNKMFTAVQTAASAKGQSLSTSQILQGYRAAWEKLDPEVQKEWNRKATDKENGFMKFVMNDVNKNL